MSRLQSASGRFFFALSLLAVAAGAATAQEPGAAKAAVAPQHARTWTDSTGKFTISAVLLESQDGQVKLQKDDGTVISIPLEKLSKADQTYIRIVTRPKPAGTGAAADPKPPAAPDDEPTAKAPASGEPAANELYRRITLAYLEGPWDELEKSLRPSERQLAPLGRAQRAEIVSLRQAVAEGRPAWWPQCKSGQKAAFTQAVWGQPMNIVYDPAAKNSVQIDYASNLVTVTWPAADMDSTDHAEHGFSRGDLNHLTVWATLGMASAWSQVPPQSLVNLGEQGNLQLTRYLDLCGNTTGLYYGTPRARRWGLFLYLLAWKEKYAKMNTVGSRKALGSMFLAELMTHPDRYPSIPLPESLPADGAEEKLAEHVRNRIEKHGWTVAEDMLLRDALQAFAKANLSPAQRKQEVVLPNKLTASLAPEFDETLRSKRDAWLKAQFDKHAKPAASGN